MRGKAKPLTVFLTYSTYCSIRNDFNGILACFLGHLTIFDGHACENPSENSAQELFSLQLRTTGEVL